ncbi:methyltransferase [Rubrobacter xylanophilus]|uniref:Methyltransferase n=1 Tax=Rubrobacter xylanophilus TaxID=49319 RepID=A0A510HFU4_9ACTN|nr:methyltransferase [Rubrobacter xylanophilus]
MRVISGEARGVRLAPAPRGVRPTSDRVRESLFNALGQFFEGGEVLDLYAGTGALGIEALSRGCHRATFVEKNPRAAATIRENLKRTGLEGRARVVVGDAVREMERLRRDGKVFNLIFADPPYRIAATGAEGLLRRAEALLAPGGRFILESGEEPALAEKKGETRRYGGTFVTIFERSEAK